MSQNYDWHLFTDVAQINVKFPQNSAFTEIAACNYVFFSDFIDDHKKKSEDKGVFSHSSARPESPCGFANPQ